MARTSGSMNSIMNYGDKRIIKRIIEDTACVEKPLAFTGWTEMRVSYMEVALGQSRNLSMFLLASDILRG